MRESIKPAEMCCLTLRYLAALQHAVRTEANFIGYLSVKQQLLILRNSM